ncbi:MAG: preprotein translocase subunit SecA [Candidatus Tectomicrobia bacterium]|nr:preprotein translocase subunit SecA [Candidatus Tectomicrobia bacterium]
MLGLLKKFVGSKNERELKRIGATVERINALEPEAQKLTDAEIRAKTDELRKRLADGQTLEDILPEAFAACREVARRTINMRHFDVQLIGGVVLHGGKIAEMKTGEGKTLVATLSVYLNALTGKGVHIVTVNDYLARRDAEWMGPIYRGLGLTVGVIQHDMDDQERQAAYRCDVTYGTNNEFGFDYLRDNMKFSVEDMVQRELHYAIVDEVDSILIDEARTPLIISGPAEESTDLYYKINRLIPPVLKRREGDAEEAPEEDLSDSEREAISKVKYEYLAVDEKSRTVTLNERGMPEMEMLLRKAGLLQSGGLFDLENIESLHHVNQALKAHVLFQRDVDYVVQEGQVVIVDEFTGRTMPGRRYSEGLHQALEAKEGVKIETENQTLATITFQNYFRLYGKLAGMTGTADTEAAEFAQIYNLDVVVIPTNRTLIRTEFADVVYRTEAEKYNAAVEEIAECHRRGQPVLIGTISIENSEKLSRLLKRRGIPHHVLNAKHHAREAEIIAQAGRLKALTISTNMAGRGTDILLGGNPEFLAKTAAEADPDTAYEKEIQKYRAICQKEHEEVVRLGGLHVLGTERHESRRIDNQLRGRSGRQGDPGSSRFYLSLEDNLLRIFGSDRISGIMGRLGMEEGEPIEHKMVTKAIANAQKKVEAYHFEIRKHLLEYDDVMNKQREVIYSQRRQLLEGENTRDLLFEMIDEVAERTVRQYLDAALHPDDRDLEGFGQSLARLFNLQVDRNGFMLSLDGSENWLNLESSTPEEAVSHVVAAVGRAYERKEAEIGADTLRFFERVIMLQIIDDQWKDHLLAMDHLKEGIGFRGYAQKNPLNEYKREGYEMFSAMMDRIKEEVPQYLLKIQARPEEEGRRDGLRSRRPSRVIEHRGEEMALAPDGAGDPLETNRGEPATVETYRREGRKIGRNEPCPCGSGKKYKHCHGRGA